MFNNHHLPKSLLNEAASVLNNTNADFDLPQVLQDVVAEAARDYVMCPTREDRKAIIEWHIEQVMSLDDVEQQTIVNFERAVEYTVMNEGWKETVGTVAKGVGGAVKGALQSGKEQAGKIRKGINMTVGDTARAYATPIAAISHYGQLPARAGLGAVARETMGAAKQLGKSTSYMTRSIGATPGAIVKGALRGAKSAIKNEHLELLDVLVSLNESEFDAYVDMLSESEIQMLEQILQEAGFISKAAATGVSLFKGAKGAIQGAIKAYKKSQKELKDRPLQLGFGRRPKAQRGGNKDTAGRDQGTAGRDQGTAGRDQGTAGRDQGTAGKKNQIKYGTPSDPLYSHPYANDIAAAEHRGDYNEAIRLRHLGDASLKREHLELLDILASLNESEFDAYVDMLSESEIQMLEQIINENNQ